jgi:uncharacterized protein (TIRG00374 family)
MKTFLKIVVSAGLIGAILWMLGGVREIGAQILRINPAYVVPIVALTVIDRLLMTYKWSLLLRARGIRLPLGRGMTIYCASGIWGMFLPTTVGSDAIRAYLTSRIGIETREIVGSILIERFLGFLSALVLSIMSLAFLTYLGILGGEHVVPVWLLGGGMLLAAVLLFAASVNGNAFDLLHGRILGNYQHLRIARKMKEFHEAYRSFVVDRRNLATFFLLTFGEQLLPILDSWLIARGMGIDVGVLYFAAALPLALLISRIPISIDGIGVFEGVFVVLMTMAGLSAVESVAIAIVGRILQTLTLIPWWLGYVVSRKDIRVPHPLGDEIRLDAP